METLIKLAIIGISRAIFYRWRDAYEEFGKEGLINKKPCPENRARRMPIEIEEKIFYIEFFYVYLSSIYNFHYRTMNKILKIIGVNVLGIAVLAGGYIAYIIIEQKSKNAREEKVEITVKYDVEACAAQFPLHVIIQNGSDRTIYSIHFDIKVHRKGYSNNLNEWSWIKNESDKIIEPENFHSSCWHYKLKAGNERFNNPDNLIFEIGHKYIRFQRK